MVTVMSCFIINFVCTTQLAELWPDGSMDNHGIKRAISRAKERRRASCGNVKVLTSFRS